MISFFSVQSQEGFSMHVNLKTEPTDKIDFTENNIAVSFDKKIGPKNKITHTIEYSNLKVNYEITAADAIKNLNQFTNIQYRFKILSELLNTTKLNLTLTPTVNFQSHINKDDLSILGSLEINQQLNSKATINIGVARATFLGNAKILPTLSLKYKINNEAIVLIGFPNSAISYSNNIRNQFTLSNSFNGNYYQLDRSNMLNSDGAQVTLSQITSAFEYERNVDKNWFLNFKAGYDLDKKYSITDHDDNKLYDFNTGNGYVLGIGIKYKQ